MSSLTERQEALVKSSWEELKQDIPQHSLRMFAVIAEIAPETKDMFSFLKNYDGSPLNNPQMKAHAVKIFKMTGETAAQLREKGGVAVPDSALKHLGSVHLKKGVLDPHFEVVKEALLRTVKEGVGDKWSEEMNNGWAVAYDEIAAAIKKEMKE